ncbi:MAG: FAD-dependent oxidoreductase [Verrucomicrobiales bacterium]|nr:FAD-dependent oxidoreductase [Verrucomicrobiales bacterium]
MPDLPSFDFAVIGGGSGGYAAARTAASLGLSTAVIDGADELGGLCILRGCMPSKTLIESANRNRIATDAAAFGLDVQVAPPRIATIRERKRRLIADFASYRQQQLEDGRFVLYRGHAEFLDPHHLNIVPRDGSDSFTLHARTFCVATGSTEFVPPIPGLADTGFWTSDTILDTDTLPQSFVVLGGGAIALEMAHYLEGIGRQVSIVQRSRQFLTGMDPSVSQVIETASQQRGIHAYLGTQIHRVENTAEGKKRIHFDHQHSATHVEGDEILLAMGRRPATDSLNAHRAHLGLAAGKLHISPTQQTTQPHIFAAGDVCSPLDVVHLAIQQGEIAARNAHRLLTGSSQPLEEMDYRLRLFGVFCHPQVAGVGATRAQLDHAGTPYLSASYPFDDHGKSMVMGETHGFVEMLAHRDSGEILGATCVGPEATELIHEVVIAMHHHTTVEDFALIPHYHPTLSEIWTYPAEDLADQRAAIQA